MSGTSNEYRYIPAVRRRAVLLFGVGLVLVVGLASVLVLRWGEFSVGTRGIALILFVALLFTVRGQLARILFRCLIEPDALRIVAPLSGRRIPWERIVEVRRMPIPQFAGNARWACTLLVQAASASPRPIFAFDNQLEHAEEALQEIIRRTPRARHVNQ